MGSVKRGRHVGINATPVRGSPTDPIAGLHPAPRCRRRSSLSRRPKQTRKRCDGCRKVLHSFRGRPPSPVAPHSVDLIFTVDCAGAVFSSVATPVPSEGSACGPPPSFGRAALLVASQPAPAGVFTSFFYFLCDVSQHHRPSLSCREHPGTRAPSRGSRACTPVLRAASTGTRATPATVAGS